MATKWAAKRPAPILAACGIFALIGLGGLTASIYLLIADPVLAVLPFAFVLIIGFLGYGVWQGQRRGSQLVVIVFAVALWAVASNMSAQTVVIPVLAQTCALALALLVTIPRSARAWFSPKRD